MLSRLLVPTLAMGLLLSGCGATPDAPTPSPVPSPMCTPEFGGDEYPCSQHEFDKMKERDTLYAEAEELNAQLQAIVDRLYREGAPETIPEDLKAITAGSARTEYEEYVASLREFDVKMVGGETQLVYVERNPDSKEGSELALSVCVDTSSASVLMGGKDEGPGDPVIEQLYFKRVDGVLKIWAIDGEFVQSCK